MKEKTRKILIMAMMAALIISLMAASLCYAFTYGRYTGGRFDEDSRYDDLIDFVGATAFEVSTPDEFVNAIENGYSYIKISEGAEEPFVINNDIADVYTNLVLDVNGTTVIRNSRNPVLDVRRSISVVLVYDSSVEGSGGFYNPVGSALQTSGGSLTVGSGVYESGPSDAADATLLSSNTVSLVTRENRTSTEYGTASSSTLPILTKSGGDKYLPEGWNGTEGAQIKEDTYLLYTEVQNAFVGNNETSGDATFESGQLYVNCKEFKTDGTQTTYSADIFSPVSNVASCDFYYYYPIDNDAYSTTAGSPAAPKTYAVVYGYNDVKGLAEDEDDNNDGIGEATALIDDGLVWPYAAIRSVEDGEVGGVTHARGGTFTTNFGTDNTYGIYSVGGTMTVGTDSASTPPVFTATGEGICIGMSAGENDTLTIENGEFSSKIGDTIKMSGGEMEVKKGKFTKDATKDATGAPNSSTNNGSAISISGGKLNVKGASTVQFNIKGSYVNGIRTEKETTGEVEDDEITNAAFNFNTGAGESGSSNIGISANGGTTIATNCTFTMPGSSNIGISANGGTTTATGSEFTLTGNRSYGVYAENGETTVSGCTIDMTGEYVSGIYTTGGTVTVDGGTVEVSFAKRKTDNLLTSTAVSTEGGKIAMAGNVRIASESLGITARSGTITIDETADVRLGRSLTESEGSVEVSENLRATGIYVNNGTITNEGTIDLLCAIDDDWNWVNRDGSAYSDFNKYNGVYVQGGSLISNGTLNVTFKGVENDEYKQSDAYLNQQTKSYAVRVEAGADTTASTKVTIASGEITNSVGGGVLVNGGAVTLGKQETTNGVTTYSGPTVQTTGNLLYANRTYPDRWDWSYVVNNSWQYMLNKSGGHAVEVSGGSLTVHGGKYTAQQGNGILIRNTSDDRTTNTVKINSGSFVGYNSGYYIEYDGQTPLGGDRMVGPAASYGLNVMGHDLDVRINGGEFGNNEGDVGNSAASFFGTPDGSRPQVAVHGGTFNANNADAISVFRFIDITFDGTASKISSNISNGAVASLSVQDDLLYTGESDRGSTIEIQSGTFTGTAYGIWYACGYDKLSISGNATIEGSTGLQVHSAPVENGIAISGGTIEGGTEGIYYNASASVESEGYGLNITGGTITGKQDGIHYGSNGTAANGLLISGGTITGTNGSGLNLAGAPAASGAVTISGGTITGSNHGVYYGASGAVNDGLLIEGGTITGSNGSGLYFAVNPWQNGGTNNVAIVGGTFNGKIEKGSNQNPFYINGAISAPSSGESNKDYSGLGKQIRLGDILKTHTGDGKVAYVEENLDWDGNKPLGDNYNYSIAVTVSSMESVSIKLYNQ